MLAGGWIAYVHYWRHGGGRSVAWRDLSAEVGPLQFPRATFRVFLRPQKLTGYLDAVMPGRAPATPPIDFAHRKAVLIAAGPRSSTGYDLRVVRVTERRSCVDVVLRERTPSLGERESARLTFPYRLITIPATTKSIHFRYEGRP